MLDFISVFVITPQSSPDFDPQPISSECIPCPPKIENVNLQPIIDNDLCLCPAPLPEPIIFHESIKNTETRDLLLENLLTITMNKYCNIL